MHACMLYILLYNGVLKFTSSLHPLLEDRVDSSLADDEISPLCDNNRHKEPRVTGGLQQLPLLIALVEQNNTNLDVTQGIYDFTP